MKNGVEIKKPINRKKQKLIYLKWHDAHSDGGWRTEQGVIDLINEEYCICENVGWLICEDDKEITICSRRLAWDECQKNTYEFGLFQKIPITWVIERRYLK